MKRAIVIVPILCAIAFAAYLFYKSNINAQHAQLHLQNKHYALRTNLFDSYKTISADVVMLGNSLTEWVEWNELLGRPNIANRGIASDVTSGYLHRLEQVFALKPKLCFIEGGINDLYANVPVDVVFANYKLIVESLHSRGVIPIIQSTLFVSPKWHSASEKNKEVAALNMKLERFARASNVEFINLNAHMSEANTLRDELTYDGVHLTAAGYKIWGGEVEVVLKRYNL